MMMTTLIIKNFNREGPVFLLVLYIIEIFTNNFETLYILKQVMQ